MFRCIGFGCSYCVYLIYWNMLQFVLKCRKEELNLVELLAKLCESDSPPLYGTPLGGLFRSSPGCGWVRFFGDGREAPVALGFLALVGNMVFLFRFCGCVVRLVLGWSCLGGRGIHGWGLGWRGRLGLLRGRRPGRGRSGLLLVCRTSGRCCCVRCWSAFLVCPRFVV